MTQDEDKEDGMPKVTKVIRANEVVHGFNGYLGLCDGHPYLETGEKEDYWEGDKSKVIPLQAHPIMKFARKCVVGEGMTRVREMTRLVS